MTAKLSGLVRLDDVTPNRATVTAVGSGDQLLWYCPEHGAEPYLGQRIYLAHLTSRPRCCLHGT